MTGKEVRNMSDDCSHECSSCQENCSSREQGIPKEPFNAMSSVKKVIGIVSGKGGVGKSLVTALTASELKRKGYRVGIMDADVTGPSIPRMFGITDKASGDDSGIFPVDSRTGIRLMSVNLLLPDEMAPVIWRGPVISGVVKQFWTDVVWEDLDYLLIDMPPGTGDVPLTVFQSIPLDGILVVSSPQELVEMIVEKAAGMAELMKVPILGLVENMSYLVCPSCGERINLFGESKAEEVAKRHSIASSVRLPLVPEIAEKCDKGMIEDVKEEELAPIITMLEKLIEH